MAETTIRKRPLFRQLSVWMLLCTFFLKGHAANEDLRLPVVPAELTTVTSRADYVAIHFFDNLDEDRSRLRNDEWLEQTTVNLLSIISLASDTVQPVAFGIAIDSVGKERKVLKQFMRLVDKYLDEPESPMFSEAVYCRYLSALLASGLLDQYERVRPEYQLSALSKNSVGDIASDFEYLDRHNAHKTLLTTNSPLLLMILYDPDCEHCAEVMRVIGGNGLIKEKVDSGQLDIIAVYADGDETLWADTAERLPTSWIGALDVTGIQEHELYTVRDFPAIYLLDSNKRILLKDAKPDDIVLYLNKLP